MQARLQAVEDIREIMATEATIPNLTWEELAKALGVEKNADGNLPGVELFNACLNAQGNPMVATLPHDERIRVLRTAAAAMDNLWPGG